MASSLKLKIHGMHCEACVRRVTKALGSVPGVEIDEVRVGEASLSYDANKADPEKIAEAIKGAGFDARC